MVHTVEEESDPGCPHAERRRNRTGDPILTIDAPVVHNAVYHLTSHTSAQVSGAAEGCVVGRGGGCVWQSFWQMSGKALRGLGANASPGGPRPQLDGICGAENDARVDPVLDSLPARAAGNGPRGRSSNSPVAGTAAPSPGDAAARRAARPTRVPRTIWSDPGHGAAGCPRAVSTGRRRQFRRGSAPVRGRGRASRGRGRTG
jgi:hypothetical protein